MRTWFTRADRARGCARPADASDSREGAASAVAQMLEALAELGYVEGRNLAVEGRFGASEAQLPTVAAELARSEVNIIVPFGTPAARAAKAATATIPIVTISSDPVGAGLVEAWCTGRPGPVSWATGGREECCRCLPCQPMPLVSMPL